MRRGSKTKMGSTHVSSEGHDSEADEDAVDRFRNFLSDRFGSEKAAFDEIDINANGEISYGELELSLKRIGVSAEEATGGMDFRNLFRLLDVDGGGYISLYELSITTAATRRQAMQRKEEGWRAEDPVDQFRHFMVTHFGSAEDAFAAFDKNQDGVLSLKELGNSLKRIGVTCVDASGVRSMRALFDMMASPDAARQLTFWHLFGSSKAERDLKKRKSRPKKPAAAKSAQAVRDAEEPVPEEDEQVELDDDVDQTAEREIKEKLKDSTLPWVKKIVEFEQDVEADDLDLRHMFMGKPGALRLAVGLRESGAMRSMNTMDLTGNYIGPGILRLAVAIETRCSLQRLLLPWNSIVDDGAEGLARLVKLSTLTELDVSSNRIGDEGAGHFVKALTSKQKPTLRKLDLRSNRVGR